MPKLQYNSDDDLIKSVSDNEIELTKPVKREKKVKEVYDDIAPPVVKEVKKAEKKPRSDAQIEATNRMREQLKVRRENDIKLKTQAKLEYEERQRELKKKIQKLTLKDKVEKTIKKIVETDDSSSSEEEVVVKKKSKDKKPHKKPKAKPSKYESSSDESDSDTPPPAPASSSRHKKQYTPPPKQAPCQQPLQVRFF